MVLPFEGTPRQALPMDELGNDHTIVDEIGEIVTVRSNKSSSGNISPPKSARSQDHNSVATGKERGDSSHGGRRSAEKRDARIDSGKDSTGHDSHRTGSHPSRTSTPQYLQPPEQDVRPEQLILNSEEAMVDLRKRDREALKASAQVRKGVS